MLLDFCCDVRLGRGGGSEFENRIPSEVSTRPRLNEKKHSSERQKVISYHIDDVETSTTKNIVDGMTLPKCTLSPIFLRSTTASIVRFQRFVLLHNIRFDRRAVVQVTL